MRDGVVSTIAGIADRARDAGDALDLWAAREAQARRDARGLSVAGWADLPRAVRARLLRGEAIAGGVDPDAVGHRVVEQIDLALLHPDAHPRTWDLRPARRLVVHDGWLRLEASRA
jgi:hypothetical protein